LSRESPTVFVVDDDLSIREALKNLLRSVGLKVETFGTAKEFLERKGPDEPGCLILDVRLPGESGLDLQSYLVRAKIRTPVIFITGHGDIPMSVRAMKAGALEFLTKPFRDQDLLDAVQQAIERDRQNRLRRADIADTRKRYESLTVREQEVLALVAQGLINKQVGEELQIGEPTVKLHRGRLMQKMGAESIVDLIRMAEKLGIPGKQRPN
jgi:FixJ family two-component response regulator